MATPNFGELEKIFSGEDFFLIFFQLKSSIVSFISATLEHQRISQKNPAHLYFRDPPSPQVFSQITTFKL